jgi:tRNA-2-methylthio-N6-dimethylallyladenosine synthase
MARLVEVVERHALARHEARVGRVESLLLEGRSKKDAAAWAGRTRQNKLVHFTPASDEQPEVGGSAEVRITRGAPHWLQGELLALTPPRRPPRVRIPVSAAPA